MTIYSTVVISIRSALFGKRLFEQILGVILRFYHLRKILVYNKQLFDKPFRYHVLFPTGSGKTIILTHFMDEYTKSRGKTVFVWLTPGTF